MPMLFPSSCGIMSSLSYCMKTRYVCILSVWWGATFCLSVCTNTSCWHFLIDWTSSRMPRLIMMTPLSCTNLHWSTRSIYALPSCTESSNTLSRVFVWSTGLCFITISFASPWMCGDSQYRGSWHSLGTVFSTQDPVSVPPTTDCQGTLPQLGYLLWL